MIKLNLVLLHLISPGASFNIFWKCSLETQPANVSLTQLDFMAAKCGLIADYCNGKLLCSSTLCR